MTHREAFKQLIRLAVDSATRARPAALDVVGWLADTQALALCRCGHEKLAHHAWCCECATTWCQIGGCPCSEFAAEDDHDDEDDHEDRGRQAGPEQPGH